MEYDLFVMKDKDFNMKLMSTYGGLNKDPRLKMNKRFIKQGNTVKIEQFVYPVPFSNHYKCRHAVDDNNNLRQQMPSIEKTWITGRWANRVFAFLLAVSEVNTYKVSYYLTTLYFQDFIY